jgi:hypothetical protein
MAIWGGTCLFLRLMRPFEAVKYLRGVRGGGDVRVEVVGAHMGSSSEEEGCGHTSLTECRS